MQYICLVNVLCEVYGYKIDLEDIMPESELVTVSDQSRADYFAIKWESIPLSVRGQ